MHPYMKNLARTAAIAALVTGCFASPDEILSVTDPDIINPTDVQSSAGANAVRLGALARLNSAYSGVESYVQLGGLLADEWRSGDTFVDRDQIDRRVVIRENAFFTTATRGLYRARTVATLAVDLMKQYTPTAASWQLAEMYWVRGFVENILAEDYCNGMPLSEVVNGVEQPGNAVTTTALYAMALVHIDSGLALIGTGTTADDNRVRNALMITRARILMNQNQPAAAGAAVTTVPTSHRHYMFHSVSTTSNQTWSLNNNARRYNLSDAEGTNGMPFITAADPRVPSCVGGTAPCTAAGVSSTGTRPFDNTTTFPFRAQLLWTASTSQIEITSGVEARLMEAEASLRAGTYATPVTGGLAILNNLRAATGAGSGGVAGLAALTDPVTPALREDQLFRERAFWLFGKGHRVGDLRRLVRQYNRAANSVWPTGTHHKGGSYGPDMNFPVPQAEDNNINFTTPSTNDGRCIDRNA